MAGDIEFSPDGSTLAVMTAAPTRQPVMLLDADTLEPLPAQPGGVRSWRWEVQDLSYSSNGRVLAATMRRVQGRAATTEEHDVGGCLEVRRPARPIRRIPLAEGAPAWP